MIRTRLGLLGLCAVVLGVMAFSASAAQATVGAKWLILDPNGTVLDAANLPATIGGTIENEEASLLSKVLGIAVEILCKKGTLIGVSLEKEGSLTNGGKVQFTGCSVDLNGTPNPACEPHSAGSPVGTVETLAGKGLAVLHELAGGVKHELTRIEPKEGETFVTINMGEECPIGELIPVRGKLFLKDCENAFLTHQVIHLVEEFPVLTDLWVLNKTAEHKATIDGSALIFLTGAHLNYLWGGDV